MRSETLEVPTPAGAARVHRHAPAGRRRATLVLGHGAGGGVAARDLAALAAALPRYGIEVDLVEQPWLVAGRRVASPPAALDLAWLAVVRALDPPPPLLLGGRSAGARVACRTALDLQAAGVLALAFPLHPPGRPDRSRAQELTGAGVPVLVVQGERDSFGGPGELPSGWPVVVVPWADHGMAVPARAPITQGEALEVIVQASIRWALKMIGNRRGVARG